MVRAYFVSDIHMESMEDEKAQLFLSFLKSKTSINEKKDEGVSHLFLLGDIFDLWVGEYSYFINKFSPIISEIKRLINLGVEVHIFEGNHDLYLMPYWKNTLGAFVHEQGVTMQLGTTQIRLEHGDQMDPEDKGYIFLRWFLRFPPIKWLNLHLPQKLVLWIGEKASKGSRAYTSEVKVISKEGTLDKVRFYAEKLFAVSQADLLIAGHVHVQIDESFRSKGREVRYVNLGSWMDEPCAFIFDESTNDKKILSLK